MYVTMVSTTIGDISYLRDERKSQRTKKERMKLFIIMGRFDIYIKLVGLFMISVVEIRKTYLFLRCG